MLKNYLNLNEKIQKSIMFLLFIVGLYLLFHNYKQVGNVSYMGFVEALGVFGVLTYIVAKVGTRYEVLGVLMIISIALIFYGFIYDDNEYSKGYSNFMNFFKVTTIFFAYIMVIFFFVISKFEFYPKFIFGELPEDKEILALKKIRDIVEKNRDELEKIELYTIDNIGREYKALGMVESTEASKDDGKIALQLQAFRLEADAIVNVVSSTTSTTQGDIKADTILSPGGGGNIRTSIMYHYEGTAIKYL